MVTMFLITMCFFFVLKLDRYRKVNGNRCWFLVYLTVLSVTSEWHSKPELEGMWKECAMTRFEAVSCRLPQGTEETHEGVQSE